MKEEEYMWIDRLIMGNAYKNIIVNITIDF